MWVHVSVSRHREARKWKKTKSAAEGETVQVFLALGTPKPLIRPQITR